METALRLCDNPNPLDTPAPIRDTLLMALDNLPDVASLETRLAQLRRFL